MNTNDIAVVRKVCETGSLSKAAEQLYMTPQAVSVTVRRVESRMGVDLFQRSTNGMHMNHRGILFYEKSDALIRELKELEDLFHLDIQNQQGVLRVAFSQGIIVMLGINNILGFCKDYPNFRIEIIEGPDKKVEELVDTGRVDIGVSTAPLFSSDFYIRPWRSFRCGVVISSNCELGKELTDRQEISVSDLRDIPIVLENKDFAIYREFRKICREKYQFEPNIFFETVEIENALTIAAEGFAAAVVPMPVAEKAQYDNIYVAPIRESLYWSWCMIRKKNHPLTEIEEAFMSYLFSQNVEG